MPKKGSVNRMLADAKLSLLTPLFQFLGARDMTADATKKQDLEKLLLAVAEGNETLAREIVTSYPGLALAQDQSIVVKTLAGKEFTNQSPLQLAICEWDVDMAEMITKILYQKLQEDGEILGCKTIQELDERIQRQFTEIFPKGDIGSVVMAQKIKANKFINYSNILKNYNLFYILNKIDAATDAQVEYELKTPGRDNPGSPLNIALHNFRKQFATNANSEQIFNPFYLIEAFGSYIEKYKGFKNNLDTSDKSSRRNLVWRQVIGYIQRYSPACLLQAYAQGIYYITNKNEKLKRDIKFTHDISYMQRDIGDLKNLGYIWACYDGRMVYSCGLMAYEIRRLDANFQNLFLSKKLDLQSLLGQSHNGSNFRPLTPENLLLAVAEGNETLAREIVTSYPGFALAQDQSIVVKTLAGKKFTNQSPLQLAICEWDVDMAEMITEILYQKLHEDGEILGCKTKQELDEKIQCQFAEIFPDGDINSIRTAQNAKAQEFKTSMLRDIFAEINAAKDGDVMFELENPGKISAQGQLNAALHNFRTHFATIANAEQIFNASYLLKAFELYEEEFNNFKDDRNANWSRKDLFWRQVIGYIQRYLPACYLQKFAQGCRIYDITERNKKLKRDFKFAYNQKAYMLPVMGDLNNLGYRWAGEPGYEWSEPSGSGFGEASRGYSIIIEDKKNRFGELTQPAHNGSNTSVTFRLGA